MTPEEAIEIIEKQIVNCEAMIDFNENFDPEEDNTKFLKEKEALLMAVKSIKEVQRYRAIGTVEECKELASMVIPEKKNALGQIVDEWKDYIEIGTVEECREAVEKQKPKNPVKDKYHHNCCPNCGWIVSGEGGYGEEFCPHCENCGQAIQWENLEGMEYERD